MNKWRNKKLKHKNTNFNKYDTKIITHKYTFDTMSMMFKLNQYQFGNNYFLLPILAFDSVKKMIYIFLYKITK